MMKTLSIPSLPDDRPWSGPVSLRDHEKTVLTVDVEDGEVVAVIHDDRVTSVLLPARHCLHVLGEDEDAHDLSARDIAWRAGYDEREAGPLLSRLRHVQAGSQLLRLDTGPLPTMSWSSPGAGYYRAHVDSPARFYESFLRHSEGLPGDRFVAIAGAVVGECLARSATNSDEAEVGSTERRWRERARRGLREVGMRLEDFEVVRAETVPDPTSAPEGSRSRPSLAR